MQTYMHGIDFLLFFSTRALKEHHLGNKLKKISIKICIRWRVHPCTSRAEKIKKKPCHIISYPFFSCVNNGLIFLNIQRLIALHSHNSISLSLLKWTQNYYTFLYKSSLLELTVSWQRPFSFKSSSFLPSSSPVSPAAKKLSKFPICILCYIFSFFRLRQMLIIYKPVYMIIISQWSGQANCIFLW